MKTVKFPALALLSLGMCLAAVSCSDDDKDRPDWDKPTTGDVAIDASSVFPNGAPRGVNGLTITTDERGDIVSLSNPRDREEVIFRNSQKDTFRDGVQYDLTMYVRELTKSADMEVFYLKLDHAGRITYARQYDDDREMEEWWMEYNHAGQLTKVTRTDDDHEVTDIRYKDGDIVSVTTRDRRGEGSDYTIDYGTLPYLDNKGCIMLFDDLYGVDIDDMQYAYWAGLLGTPTYHLPLGAVYTETDHPGRTYTATYHWTYGAAPDYPTTLMIEEPGEQPTLISFTW